MPIQEQDIVFLASEVMDDVPEGGGAATGNVIPDGALRNVFPGVSSLDRVYGRLKLRALFLAIRTLTTEQLGGAVTAITALPADDSIGYTLFSIDNPFGRRVEAADLMAAYLYQGPSWHGVLHENHIAGMTAIQIIQRVNTELPTIGKTLCLVENEGLPNEIKEYVRVIKVEVAERMFTDDSLQAGGGVEFPRWAVTLTLSDRLRNSYHGHTPRYYDNQYNYTGKARVRDTTVADAMRYYSARPLAATAGVGDTKVRADSIFAPLVPATRAEEPLLDQPGAGEVRLTLATTPRLLTVSAAQHTQSAIVSPATRAYNYVFYLTPLPAPGTVSVAYRAQGRWYALSDDSAGALTGTAGGGTVNYLTGACSVSLGALPDAGTMILVNHGEASAYTDRSSSADWAAPEYQFALEVEDVEPDTFEIKWLSGGVLRTAVDDGQGALMGDAEGFIDYGPGTLRFTTAYLIDPGAEFEVDYETGGRVEELKTGLTPDGTGFVTLTTASAMTPGTVEAAWYITTTVEAKAGNTNELTRAVKTPETA